MATQEQDFNKETNRQCTRLFIKDSQGITIDLTEIKCAQVLQSLLTLSELQGRLTSSARGGGPGPTLLSRLLRPTDGEMQDIEVNTLLQGQSIHIENCMDVRSSVRQVEVEKVIQFGQAVLRLREQQGGGKALAGDNFATMARKS